LQRQQARIARAGANQQDLTYGSLLGPGQFLEDCSLSISRSIGAQLRGDRAVQQPIVELTSTLQAGSQAANGATMTGCELGRRSPGVVKKRLDTFAHPSCQYGCGTGG